MTIGKWENLLAELDVNLEAFGVSLKYSKCLSSLNEAQLTALASQAGFDFPQGCLSIWSEEDLNVFEAETELTLPQEYREYCQVFGSGRFGDSGFKIDCLPIQYLEKHLDSNRGILEAQGTAYGPELNEAERKFKQLLENAYLFGSGENRFLFVFDLRTYSEEDRSYDIYGMVDEDITLSTFFLGRDFFAFIRDVCIGQKAKDTFPKWMSIIPSNIDENHPEYADYQSITFFPLPIADNLP